MREHYGLDRLVDYATEEIPDTTRVVNPEYRRLDGQVRSKHLIDTIKMVAYRAETAMVQMAREKMHREDDARSLLRALYSTEADLLPDENAGTLTVPCASSGQSLQR